jgi:DeoR family glycerol-3-phosphate regulon repressor
VGGGAAVGAEPWSASREGSNRDSRGKRQQQILELAQCHGFVSTEMLSQRVSVTTQTVPRDINQLCQQTLLRRYHGGAGLPSSVENLAYSTRQVLYLEEKRRIARTLARHIPDQASLFINIGTTTEEVTKALMKHQGLRQEHVGRRIGGKAK